MNCNKCGKEMNELEMGTCCAECENVESTQVVAATAEEKTAGSKKKMMVVGVAAAVAVAVGAFVAISGVDKNPKDTVMAAFDSVILENQVYPVEEIFGFSELLKSPMTSNTEGGLALTVDNISEPSFSMVETGGMKLEMKVDQINQKNSGNMMFAYGGMDFLSINTYYGDHTYMITVPELVDTVFIADINDSLVSRLKQSEVLGPVLEDQKIDLNELDLYVKEFLAQEESGQIDGLFDVNALYKRYKEGSKIVDNFKAAMVVETAERKNFTLDGKTQKCKGYDVTISKDDLITFLSESSEFFLKDEALREDFLKQLEITARINQIFGGTYGEKPMAAEEQLNQTYDDRKAEVDKIIATLQTSLTDIKMTVYVDKKGRLAALDGKTSLKETENGNGTVDVSFHGELQGGAYLTQNLLGALTVSNPEAAEDVVEVTIKQTGVSDAKQLTSNVTIGMNSSEEGSIPMNVIYAGSYDKGTKAYDIGVEAISGDAQLFKLSSKGLIEKVEKGKSIQIAMDEIRVSIQDDMYHGTLSGSMYLQPLSSEVVALEGTTMDIIAATKNDWMSVIMQAYYGLAEVGKQLGIPMY